MTRLTRRSFVAAGAGAAALPILGAPAIGQAAWPNKPVRMIVPYPVGGQTDLIGRAFSDYFSRQTGQPFVVENKAGAAGTVGATEVKRSAPDGYTFMCTISTTLIQNRVMMRDLPYDPEKDFTLLTTISGIGGLVIAAKKTGASNLKEFVEYAKKADKVSFGTYAIGSFPHIIAEEMNKQYGLKIEPVHYRGEAPMFADISSQSIDIAIGSYTVGLPVVQAGHGKVIAISGNRLPPMPDVPTFVEQGATGKIFSLRGFTGLVAPAGVPADIIKRMGDMIVAANDDPKIKQLLTSFLLEPATKIDVAQARFKEESPLILDALKSLGIKPD